MVNCSRCNLHTKHCLNEIFGTKTKSPVENSPNFLRKIQRFLLSIGGVGIFGKFRTINSVLKTAPLFLNLFKLVILDKNPLHFFRLNGSRSSFPIKQKIFWLLLFKLKLRTIIRTISIICTFHWTVISIEHLALLSAVFFFCFVG